MTKHAMRHKRKSKRVGFVGLKTVDSGSNVSNWLHCCADITHISITSQVHILDGQEITFIAKN